MKKDELASPLRQPYDAKRGFGITKINAEGYKNIWFIVPPPPPRKLPDGLPMAAMSKANATLSRLPTFEEMEPIDKLINHFFVRREAIESSRMEGTWSTIDSILTPAQAHETELAKSESLSVKGYARALEKQFNKAFKMKEQIFSEQLVCEIHADIVSKDPNYQGTPGELRKPGNPGSIVQIGSSFRKEDSTYNPAPPQHVKTSLRKVLNWLSDEDLAQRGDAGIAGFTLAVRLAIGHVHFEAVHPFSDGNGRVGRALWPLQMICADRMPLYLSGFVEDQKTEYGKALQAAQKKLNYAPIIEFICQAIVESEAESKTTRAAIESLPSRWKERGKFRDKSASFLALNVLQKKPILTTSTLIEELKLSRQVATLAINQLVERKIIRKRGKVGRNQIFAAEELISLLSRRFGSNAHQALKTGYNAILEGPALYPPPPTASRS